jgi:arabinan endo-1,5-alpha-L-arabinosidase
VCSLALKDIHLRDPFVLEHDHRYYLYGTRGATVWTEADGFDCYTSEDLVSWSGPHEIFHRDRDFWADRCFWAPECYLNEGAFYLLVTLGSEDGRMGVQVLAATDPLGPFMAHSEGPVTPPHQECLDGTLYLDDDGAPYLLFSRSFRQASVGETCALELAPDLKSARGDILRLFEAADAPWARPFPFAKRFGIDGDVYLSDGPFVYKTRSRQLLLLWSSFGPSGYAVGVARSATGDIRGPWTHDAQPLYDKDGGHGMVFTSGEGALMLALHAPNAPGQERPRLIELTETEDDLFLRRTTKTR